MLPLLNQAFGRGSAIASFKQLHRQENSTNQTTNRGTEQRLVCACSIALGIEGYLICLFDKSECDHQYCPPSPPPTNFLYACKSMHASWQKDCEDITVILKLTHLSSSYLTTVGAPTAPTVLSSSLTKNRVDSMVVAL